MSPAFSRSFGPRAALSGVARGLFLGRRRGAGAHGQRGRGLRCRRRGRSCGGACCGVLCVGRMCVAWGWAGLKGGWARGVAPEAVVPRGRMCRGLWGMQRAAPARGAAGGGGGLAGGVAAGGWPMGPKGQDCSLMDWSMSSATFLPLMSMPPKMGPMRKLPLTPLAAMPETKRPG